jgi:hypothetical protein
MDTGTLERDFNTAFAAFMGRDGAVIDDFFNFCAEHGSFIDEDLPFPLDKAGFVDHIQFHLSGLWDSMLWKPQKLSFAVHGGTGLVSGYFVLRGKPKHAGFRLRPGFCTVTCAWDTAASAWRALNIHLSPLRAQILDASPS